MELREKLRLTLQTESARPLTRVAATSGPPRSTLLGQRLDGLPVRRTETGCGTTYMAEQWWPLDHRHGRLPLGDALALQDVALSRLAPGLDGLDLAGTGFIDVETTGLAGGTGTYVFLVGIGTFENDAFRLRQFFLADLPGERTMLAAVAEVIAGCRALVSFNGRRFDIPLLETRLTLSRLPPLMPDLPHVDLLYPARRLYRWRLPSCRLASLEESLLGLEREDDVAGWAIPALYFGYLRRGEARPLRAVFRHNSLDILSMVTLLVYLGHLVAECPPSDPNDRLALARWDESERRVEDAARLYVAAIEGGLDAERRTLALRRLARICRRLGRWEEAARLWRQEVEECDALERRVEALVELAKLEEHRRRDYAAAEALTRRASSLLEVAVLRGGGQAMYLPRREALEHRLWRLRRRLEGREVSKRTV
jgi:hypothetical protein